jgi:hypothetical protein
MNNLFFDTFHTPFRKTAADPVQSTATSRTCLMEEVKPELRQP